MAHLNSGKVREKSDIGNSRSSSKFDPGASDLASPLFRNETMLGFLQPLGVGRIVSVSASSSSLTETFGKEATCLLKRSGSFMRKAAGFAVRAYTLGVEPTRFSLTTIRSSSPGHRDIVRKGTGCAAEARSLREESTRRPVAMLRVPPLTVSFSKCVGYRLSLVV